MNNNTNVVALNTSGLSSQDKLVPVIEAFLFSQKKPIRINKLADMMNCSKELINQAVGKLSKKLEDNLSGLMIAKTSQKVELVPKSEYQAELMQLQQKDEQNLTAIVDEFIYVLESQGRSSSTIEVYRSVLYRFMKFIGKPVDNIDRKDIRYFLMNQKQEEGNSRSTISLKISIIKSFFNWLMDEELIEKDPSRKIKNINDNKSDPKFLTHEELELLRETADALRERSIIELLYSSGLRISEAVALDWSDIDFNNQTISVINGKGGKDRITMLSTKAIMLLKKYKDERKGNESWVFQTRFKGLSRMSVKTAQRNIKKLGKKAGISKKVTPHRLRHSFATHLLESGVTIDKVQMLLGHSNVSTTQIYAKTNQLDIEHAYKKVFH